VATQHLQHSSSITNSKQAGELSDNSLISDIFVSISEKI
jgi:hypothetical protein